MVYLNATTIVQFATMAVFVMNDLEGVYVHLDLQETIAKQVIVTVKRFIMFVDNHNIGEIMFDKTRNILTNWYFILHVGGRVWCRQQVSHVNKSTRKQVSRQSGSSTILKKSSDVWDEISICEYISGLVKHNSPIKQALLSMF